MNSPVADHQALEREELEPDLVAYRCPQTGGVFIPAESYWRWLRKHPRRLPKLAEGNVEAVEVTEPESPAATDGEIKLCPLSGTLMLRCKVGHGFPFYIERSATGGIWLDGGEWEQLRARRFHDELHLVFAAPWQRRVREAELAQSSETRLRERLGEDLYGRLVALKTDLDAHPSRSAALAYLRK